MNREAMRMMSLQSEAVSVIFLHGFRCWSFLNRDMMDSGNRARKTSGTQGTLFPDSS